MVTIHAVSIQDYINDASYLAPEGRDFLKMAKSFISPPILDSEICKSQFARNTDRTQLQVVLMIVILKYLHCPVVNEVILFHLCF